MDSWTNLTSPEIEATINGMPGGVGGYLAGWGWLTFAKAIEERSRRIPSNSWLNAYGILKVTETIRRNRSVIV